jgi:arylsulfatase A-like enzyme
MKRSLLTSIVVALVVGVPPGERPGVVAQAERPNIVIIVADDLGYADIGVHGAKDIPTPAIDSIARNGIRFTDAYVSGPYCSPTRAGLMTGRYPQRFGHEFNLNPAAHQDYGLPLTETTMASRLKAAGYRTALFGKWHLGYADRFHPLERGFDEFFGFLAGAHTYFERGAPNNPLLDGRKPVSEAPPYLTDALADRAVDFIKRHRSQPFFLYLAFNAVHTPMHATDKYLRRFEQIADERRRTYAAMLAAMDDGIGRTLSALREERLDTNTLVFFFSDNGGPTGIVEPGARPLDRNGSRNTPLRGSKTQTWEGGIRVPFMMQWPARLPRGRTDASPVIQLDVLPTVLAAVGIPIEPNWRLDGVNLLPHVTGKTTVPPHDILYWRLGGMMAVRKGDWKLLKITDNAAQADPSVLNDLSGVELYNLKDDIGETKNLAVSRSDKVNELTGAWQRWNKELARPGWPPPPGAQPPR